MSFLNSITKDSKKFGNPFFHWELNKPLTEGQIKEIINAEIANLETKVKNIKSSNSLYEVKISSLQKHDKNTDLVDEQIRNVLGYGKNNEFIIFFDN